MKKTLLVIALVLALCLYCFAACDTVVPENYLLYDCTSLTIVYYMGSEEDWANIEIGPWNSALENATIVYNYVPEE